MEPLRPECQIINKNGLVIPFTVCFLFPIVLPLFQSRYKLTIDCLQVRTINGYNQVELVIGTTNRSLPEIRVYERSLRFHVNVPSRPIGNFGNI